MDELDDIFKLEQEEKTPNKWVSKWFTIESNKKSKTQKDNSGY